MDGLELLHIFQSKLSDFAFFINQWLVLAHTHSFPWHSPYES